MKCTKYWHVRYSSVYRLQFVLTTLSGNASVYFRPTVYLFSKTFGTVNTALKSKLILLSHSQSYSYMPNAQNLPCALSEVTSFITPVCSEARYLALTLNHKWKWWSPFAFPNAVHVQMYSIYWLRISFPLSVWSYAGAMYSGSFEDYWALQHWNWAHLFWSNEWKVSPRMFNWRWNSGKWEMPEFESSLAGLAFECQGYWCSRWDMKRWRITK